jgi:hypothetical protein
MNKRKKISLFASTRTGSKLSAQNIPPNVRFPPIPAISGMSAFERLHTLAVVVGQM